MRPQVGQLINNKYKLLRLIGDGGMGSVFEAQHEALGTSVALKFLHPELSRRPGLVQRFLQEARVSAKIQSPHVVRVTDVEQTATGLAFIVMEFLKGVSLQSLYEELYRAGKRLSYEESLNYALQMLDGLEAAHEEGIIHRDLKPDNVMITKGKRGEPVVKLCDFGIAKLKINGELYKGLTRPGVIMGTPEYMAPEQVFSADQVDVRADIFSCGVMIFEMLAGRRPVGGDEPHQIAAQYLAGSVARLTDLAPHVPPELAAIIHKAMSPDPKDRYDTVAEFRQVIEPFAKKVPQADRLNSTPPPQLTKESDRRSVPKTIPPQEDEASDPYASTSSAVDGAATDQSPQRFSGQAQHGTSVIKGSVGALGEHTIEGLGANELAAIRNSRPDQNGASRAAGPSAVTPAGMAIPANAMTPGMMESTVEGAPFFPGATDAYDPTAGVALRPGGTNIGDASAIAGTVGYNAPYAPAGVTPGLVVSAPLPQTPSPRPKKGVGVIGILAAAAAIAGLAVGGVYFYSQYGNGGGDDKPVKTVALPTSSPVQATEQPQSQTPAQPQPAQPQQPTQPEHPAEHPTTPTHPQGPLQPKPPGTEQPKQPTFPPPFVVPSSFQIPGLDLPPPPWAPQPQPQPAQPQPPPPQEEPHGRPKIPPIGKLILAPSASPQPSPSPSASPTTTASTAPAATTSQPAAPPPQNRPRIPRPRLHLEGMRLLGVHRARG